MRFSQIIPLLIPIIATSYGIGDYLSWWDDLRGRTAALAGIERLASGEQGLVFIYADEKEFPALVNLINSRTENPDVRSGSNAYQFRHPSAIARLEEPLKLTPLPKNWPPSFYLPDATPVIYTYGVTREIKSEEWISAHVGTIGHVRRWINEERDRERFFVLTVLIGILSIASWHRSSKPV